MAVAIDAITTDVSQGPAASLTFSHTCAGNRRLLTIGVSIVGTTGVGSITYGGNSLTEVDEAGGPGSTSSEIWYLVNPPTGTHDVVITWSFALAGTKRVTAVSWTGVDQTSPIGTPAVTSSSTTGMSTSTSTSSTDVVYDNMARDAGSADTPHPGSSQTLIYRNNDSTLWQAGSTRPGLGVATMEWTWPNNHNGAMVIVPIHQDSSTPTPDPGSPARELAPAPLTYPARADSAEGNYTFIVVPKFDCTVTSSSQLVVELELDTQQDCQSVNKRVFYSNSLNLVSYLNGAVAKGLTVALPKPTKDQAVRWYFRARTRDSHNRVSEYSDIKLFDVPAESSLSTTKAVYADTPDEGVYEREGDSSNLFRLLRTAFLEKQILDLETLRIQQDAYLAQARLTAVEDTFSKYLGYFKGDLLNTADFFHQVNSIWNASVSHPGTWQAVVDYVTSVVGEPPVILDLSTPIGWRLSYHYLPHLDFPSLSPLAVLYPRPKNGSTFRVYVWNSWGVEIDQTAVTEWIRMLKPPHIEVQVVFPTYKHSCVSFAYASDWATCSITNGTAVADSVKLTAFPLTILTPEIDGGSVVAWGRLETDFLLSGQTATVELRSRASQSDSYSNYELIYPEIHPPFRTPIRRFFQMKITATSADEILYVPLIHSVTLNYLRS